MKKRIFFSVCLSVSLLLPVSSAHAGQLSTNGSTFSWDDSKLYQPISGCSRYNFNYTNSPSILSADLRLTNKFGVDLGSAMSMSAGSGVVSMQVCSYQNFTNPLTLTLQVQQSHVRGDGSSQITSTEVNFLSPNGTSNASAETGSNLSLQIIDLRAQVAVLTTQNSILNAKLNRICKVKPKPKNC